ncbi:hypothetical protein CLM86_06140 [Pseudomonas aeruginosa]|nr:hypothetical protein CLM86_06140 [Pseudomonas aeruginosa]
MSDLKTAALEYHAQPRPGKLSVELTKPTATARDLSLAYSPGVAEPVREIARDAELAYQYTGKGNLVAVISDGTAILGLGNLGPLASKPVMEGKGVLFKRFAGIDVFDIEVDAESPQAFIDTVKRISITFGGINLEDIKAPECFEIERALIEQCDIPVFHDDQHGTAIVTAAGMLNALELAGKKLEEAKIVCLGAGAAAISCMKLLVSMGAKVENIYMIDRKGVIHAGRDDLNQYKSVFATETDKRTLADALEGADVFVGLSGANLLEPEDLKRIERELAEQTAAYRRFSPGLPSNLMLERIGPRRWIACLMLVWGCLSTAMLLVETARGFYLLRFLLGVAEAGFFPGILVYLNRWFPARRRGQITALFAIAVPMAGVIGGPLSGWILEGFHDALGLRGWQWMFLIEGLPVVLLGVVVWCSLPESFERVTWLSDEQKHLLREELAGEEQRKTITSFSGIFSNPQVWLLVAIYFAVMLAVNTIAFWMPSLIHGAGIAQDSRIGMLSAVPYLAGCAFMIFIGRSSDRLRERRWHLGIPLLMAAAGLSLAALAPTSAWLVMGGLVIAGMGASAALPMFWQLPPAFLSSATLAAGIALISSFGSIAAFLAPYLIGWMRDTTQSASLALYLLAILIALGAGLVLRTPAAVVNPR